MEWNQIATHVCSAGMAALGGLWFYLKLFKGRKRLLSEALVAMFGAALMGCASSLILCAKFCADAESSKVVVGICAFAGLMGFTPPAMFRWIKTIAGQLPDERNTEPGPRFPDPPSDP